jgi:hypothetical protein
MKKLLNAIFTGERDDDFISRDTWKDPKDQQAFREWDEFVEKNPKWFEVEYDENFNRIW